MSIFNAIFKSYSERELKKIEKIVKNIKSLNDNYKNLSDNDLKNKTIEFKKELKNGKKLDELLPEAFAAVREASYRVLNMKHFDVQLAGGIILHQGRIAEMKTGEGKTLVATLSAYLNALEEKGVHIVTVNDYLAKRDAEWMGGIYSFLGLSVGIVTNDLNSNDRKKMYLCDVTYVTNNELGFDYLRDNMAVYKEKLVLRELNYVIIDEVDSILIDEARTPLIISGAGIKSTQLYSISNNFVKSLKHGKILNEEEALNPITKTHLIEEGDYVTDEKIKTATLTQEGILKAEKYFHIENLSDEKNLELQHYINNALKANYIMARDKDYVINGNEIIIVDEFTGRLMPGRRYSDGLHQAIEAKENVKVKRESKTLATITFQNFFNKYKKKSGMTGTAQTEESEFRQIYSLDVVAVKTNKKNIRIDHSDVVYKTQDAKFRAVVKDIEKSNSTGQPVLVGTVTIEKSEMLSDMLKKKNIKHNVLNAKFHAKEAEIIAMAGKKNSVTIATNMAGRGTDIKLEDGVQELGGLKIIGTERHESRRIDNQLRGRSGRQGDPGESRFYISLEDDLMRIFGSERMIKIVNVLGLNDDEAIEHKILSKAIENAQKRVENNNFATRKHLLEYDQIMNEQREIIYTERLKVLTGEDLKDGVLNMVSSVISRSIDYYTSESEFYNNSWDLKSLIINLDFIFHSDNFGFIDFNQKKFSRENLKNILFDKAKEIYFSREDKFKDNIREFERVILLRMIDTHWTEHIDSMDHMRQAISLRAYGQRDPIVEYRFLSYDMFSEMSNNIQKDTINGLFNFTVENNSIRKQITKESTHNNNKKIKDNVGSKKTFNKDKNIDRNDACPCGSGKKYKNCCKNINNNVNKKK
ncbi:MAG: preprotein translocase subunit SecA [Clostridiales bacterium]|jgi:preprotein translocase subunit SecA|nr:preprotein translocase subunit SecA [Clostridiales bacterium]